PDCLEIPAYYVTAGEGGDEESPDYFPVCQPVDLCAVLPVSNHLTDKKRSNSISLVGQYVVDFYKLFAVSRILPYLLHCEVGEDHAGTDCSHNDRTFLYFFSKGISEISDRPFGGSV